MSETILNQMIEKKRYFGSYDPTGLEQVIETQQKVIYYQEKQKHKYLYQIITVIDDFADDTNFTRRSQ